MKAKGLTVILTSAAILIGCSAADPTAESTTAVETTVVESTVENTAAAEITRNTAGTVQETAAAETAGETTADPYADLVLNKYDGLEMSAAILPRNAILPGMTVPVTITITNNGDQLVTYVHGSGSFTTPEAVRLEVNGLQPIPPEGNVGIATMNYVVKELSPGQTLSFTINVKTIEPNENFNNYTYDLFFKKQLYIGDLVAEELFEMYDDLTPAAPGAYEGVATFVYYFADDAQSTDILGKGNGYIQAPITLYVN